MTSTFSETDLDFSVLDALDFEHEVPCDWNTLPSNSGPACEDAAEWKIVVSCCGAFFFWCDKHKDEEIQIMAKFPNGIGHLELDGGCGSTTSNIFSVERIFRG